MTAATLSRLPISAGGAAAASLARGVYWVLNRLIDFGYFAVAQFMRAPVAISTIAAIVGFSMLAGGNALYFQSSRHPAPLFFAPPRHVAPAPAVKAVVPATRHPQAAIDEETTGSLGPSPSSVEAINNADVMLLQRKLAALKLFEGTADGIFGRRTATAIKTFEIKAGLKPRGKFTRELLASVLAAPVPGGVEFSPATTVTDIAPTAAAKPALARSVSTTATGAAPVPLAPLPRTVSVIRVANTAPVPADTFSANSLPADNTAVASASVPTPAAVTAPKPTTVPATQPLASAAVTEPASDSTDDSNVVAMNNLPPDRATLPGTTPAASTSPLEAPARSATTAPTQQVASTEPSPASIAPDSTSAVTATPDNTSLTPAQKLAAQMGTLPPGATPTGAAQTTVVASPDASSDPGDGAGSTDPALITKIQRGLASLGFLAQKIDGVPGEGTAKAIRNFEVFYDYKVTGLATPQLLDLLVQHGAVI